MQRILKSIVILMVLGGCAHSTMRGSVAMKISPSEAHVCLGNNEVEVGDKVSVFTNNCLPHGSRDKAAAPCQKVKTGTGTVTKLLNEHYSVVKFENGIDFSEGTFVEVE